VGPRVSPGTRGRAAAVYWRVQRTQRAYATGPPSTSRGHTLTTRETG